VDHASGNVPYIDLVPAPPPPGDGDAHRGPGTFLVVCTANVCRSPFAQFRLADALARTEVGREWQVRSAGTSAAGGVPMCPRTAAVIRKDPSGQDFEAHHRSQQLTHATLLEADLVLVASQEERRAVAMLSLAARERTFTLIEAAWLIHQPLSVAAPVPSATVQGLAETLHARRGMVSGRPGRPRRLSLPGRGPQGAPLDVADAHTALGQGHRAVVRDVSWAVRSFAQGVRELYDD
jgi:protein-tyrosine phosphatase